jgi:hypothetical protein
MHAIPQDHVSFQQGFKVVNAVVNCGMIPAAEVSPDVRERHFHHLAAEIHRHPARQDDFLAPTRRPHLDYGHVVVGATASWIDRTISGSLGVASISSQNHMLG